MTSSFTVAHTVTDINNIICMRCGFTLIGTFTIQGRRVQVYQPEFEEPWAQGLVSQHDPVKHNMEITMDQVGVLFIRILMLA